MSCRSFIYNNYENEPSFAKAYCDPCFDSGSWTLQFEFVSDKLLLPGIDFPVTTKRGVYKSSLVP